MRTLTRFLFSLVTEIEITSHPARKISDFTWYLRFAISKASREVNWKRTGSCRHFTPSTFQNYQIKSVFSRSSWKLLFMINTFPAVFPQKLGFSWKLWLIVIKVRYVHLFFSSPGKLITRIQITGLRARVFIGKWKLLFRTKMTEGFFFRDLAPGRCMQLSDDTNDHSLFFPSRKLRFSGMLFPPRNFHGEEFVRVRDFLILALTASCLSMTFPFSLIYYVPLL